MAKKKAPPVVLNDPTQQAERSVGPEAPAPVVTGMRGSEYLVRDPMTGEVRAYSQTEAAQRIAAGGIPVDQSGAEKFAVAATKREQSSGGIAFAHGAARAVTGGLIDLPADPQVRQHLEVQDAEHPVANIAGEVAGTIGGAVLGPATAPGAAVALGERAAVSLGAKGSSALGRIGARTVGSALEGGAYEGLRESTRSIVQNEPLTAEKFAFGFMMGALPGALLGGGVSAGMESVGSLARRYARAGDPLRRDITTVNVSEHDLLNIAQREGIEDAVPGLKHQLQANLKNDPNVGAEAFALAESSSPQGQVFRDELLGAQGYRSTAEEQLAGKLNELRDVLGAASFAHGARLKPEAVAKLIPESEAVLSPMDEEAIFQWFSSGGMEQDVQRALDMDYSRKLENELSAYDNAKARGRAGESGQDDLATRKPGDAAPAEASTRDIGGPAASDGPPTRELGRGDGPATGRFETAPPWAQGEAANNVTGRIDDISTKRPQDFATQQDLARPTVRQPARQPVAELDLDAIDAGSLRAESKARAAGDAEPAAWRSSKHPPVVEVYPDTADISIRNVTDGRHRLIAAREAGHESADVLVRRYDADGNLLSEQWEPFALRSKKAESRAIDARATAIADYAGKTAAQNKAFADEVATSYLVGSDPESIANLAEDAVRRGDTSRLQFMADAMRRHKAGKYAASQMADAVFVGKRQRVIREPMQQAWRQHVLAELSDELGALQALADMPAGVAGAKAGRAAKMRDLVQDVQRKLVGGEGTKPLSRQQAFLELDNLKKRLVDYVEPGEYLNANEGVAAAGRRLHERLRSNLENPALWGDTAAQYQAEANAAFSGFFQKRAKFWDLVFEDAGVADPRNPWANLKAASREKLQRQIGRLVTEEGRGDIDAVKAAFEDVRNIGAAAKKYMALSPEELAKVNQIDSVVNDAKASLDKALHFAKREAQADVLFSQARGAVDTGIAGKAAGYAVGGLPGAVAAHMVQSALNPGRALYTRAVLERTLRASESRIARGIAKFLGGKVSAPKGTGLLAGRATAGAAHLFDGETVEKRSENYHQTLAELAEVGAPGRAQEFFSTALGEVDHIVPGLTASSAAALARAAAYVRQQAQAQPRLSVFGEEYRPLVSDMEAERMERIYRGAMDPASIVEDLVTGELTREQVAAAEAAAPALVAEIRQRLVEVASRNPAGIDYQKRIQASVLMGVPIDPTMDPWYINAQQEMHQSRYQELAQPNRRTFQETGVNKGFRSSHQSTADRIAADQEPS